MRLSKPTYPVMCISKCQPVRLDVCLHISSFGEKWMSEQSNAKQSRYGSKSSNCYEVRKEGCQ